MKLVYVAGPFSGPHRNVVDMNIAAAQRVGIEVAKRGAMPVVPHANTQHPDYEQVQPYQFWIDGTMLLLCACEAVMLVAGWENSSGARGEVAAAQERGMPVFQPGDYDGLSWWLGNQERNARAQAATIPPPRETAGAEIPEGET